MCNSAFTDPYGNFPGKGTSYEFKSPRPISAKDQKGFAEYICKVLDEMKVSHRIVEVVKRDSTLYYDPESWNESSGNYTRTRQPAHLEGVYVEYSLPGGSFRKIQLTSAGVQYTRLGKPTAEVSLAVGDIIYAPETDTGFDQKDHDVYGTDKQVILRNENPAEWL